MCACTYKKAIAEQVERNGRGGTKRLVPHRGEVVEVRVLSTRIVFVHDPHLLAEHGLGGDEDRVQTEERSAEEQEERVRPGRARLPRLLVEHRAYRHEVQHELHA